MVIQEGLEGVDRLLVRDMPSTTPVGDPGERAPENVNSFGKAKKGSGEVNPPQRKAASHPRQQCWPFGMLDRGHPERVRHFSSNASRRP